MKSTRIYVYTKNIDSNYSAAKDYIPVPSNVKRITSVCCVLHNAEGYISLLREIDETQILNEMRLEDSKRHINKKKVSVNVPNDSDIKFVLKLTKILRTSDVTAEVRTPKIIGETYQQYGVDVTRVYYLYAEVVTDGNGNVTLTDHTARFETYHEGIYTTGNGKQWVLIPNPEAEPQPVYDATCTLKIIFEYEEDNDV